MRLAARHRPGRFGGCSPCRGAVSAFGASWHRTPLRIVEEALEGEGEYIEQEPDPSEAKAPGPGAGEDLLRRYADLTAVEAEEARPPLAEDAFAERGERVEVADKPG